jgi:molybdopterin-guanine dinucleotide biosynthesis protein A
MELRPYDAIVLAGGRSSRAGGKDKLALRRDGRSLLSHALAAVPGAERVVVVGPPVAEIDDPRIIWCREDPPFAGPVAAIAAALAHIGADIVVVLAGDQPAATPAVPELLQALTDIGLPASATSVPVSAAVLVDGGGVRQPLTAAYRASWLAAVTSNAPLGTGLRSLLRATAVAEVVDRWQASTDIDTAADATRLGFGPAD